MSTDIDKSGKVKNESGEKKESGETSARNATGRKERRPLGVARQRLSLNPKQVQYFRDREEVPRWINDHPGRLEAATEEDSYRFVTKEELPGKGQVGQHGPPVGEGVDGRVSRIVGRNDDGSPIRAYLMAKPKEDYDEDMASRNTRIFEKEAQMQQGIDSYGQPGVDGRYIPQSGISIKRT